ncbi:MAG: amidohydrolase [Acidimicrobiia bacterium]|nr:amidohydrolase [Acidimicrobiia bacterium]
MRRVVTLGALVLSSVMTAAGAQAPSPLLADLDKRIAASEPLLLEWRRHLHQHPELSNREVETAKFVADKLRSFGLEPQTGVARHGVVAVLTGGLPGPTVALRADMDGLPVREETDLPFASKATGEYEGNTVGVMHACGHDTHVAMLLTAAKVLSEMKDRLPGSVKFIFQPAEEGAPAGERPAGAEAMVAAGVMKGVDAVFGLHVFSNIPTGHLTYRSGPFMAASDQLDIIVRGRQTHGATPWRGIDPIVVGSQIVMALQTIVSRGVDITALPAIVTIGQFQAGVRNNIIPDSARLVGTIRTFDDGMQADIHAKVKRIAENVAEAAGTTAQVTITKGYPVTVNHPALTTQMLPTLERVAPGAVKQSELITGAEDFTYFQRQAPGLFVFLGITPPAQVGKAPQNHSPLFAVDEKALPTGARALVHLAVDYMTGAGTGVRR